MTTKQEYNMIVNENSKLKDAIHNTEINNQELQQKIKLLDIELKIVNIESKDIKKELEQLEDRIEQLESKLFCITY